MAALSNVPAVDEFASATAPSVAIGTGEFKDVARGPP
jgi:hypothetical protein